jgi:hypothetical protein
LTVLHPSGNPALNLIVPQLAVAETMVSHTGTEVVIGCDVLGQCDFHYGGRAGIFSLAY